MVLHLKLECADPAYFDQALDLCESLAQQTVGKQRFEATEFTKVLRNAITKDANLSITNSFYEIYLALKKVKEDGRDTIWRFILSNTYKPYFMMGKFDYIIGNPPWFTYASIPNGDYQDQLLNLATQYRIKPQNGKNMPHLEIAAIFLAHCTNYFLRAIPASDAKPIGRLGFVLPRSFFAADQHDNTRNAVAKGFRLTAAWDLKEVTPLFRIPSCVLFAEKTTDQNSLPAAGLTGLELKGNLPAHNCNWVEAKPKLTETIVTYFLRTLGKSSALTTNQDQGPQQTNQYKK